MRQARLTPDERSHERDSLSSPSSPSAARGKKIAATPLPSPLAAHLHAAIPIEHHRPVSSIDVEHRRLQEAGSGPQADGGPGNVVERVGSRHCNTRLHVHTPTRQHAQSDGWASGARREVTVHGSPVECGW